MVSLRSLPLERLVSGSVLTTPVRPSPTEIAFGCLERLPAGELSLAMMTAITTIRQKVDKFYEVSAHVQHEYFPKRGSKGKEVYKLDFDACLIGIGALSKALEEVMEVPSLTGHFDLIGDLEHLLTTRQDYREGMEFHSMSIDLSTLP